MVHLQVRFCLQNREKMKKKIDPKEVGTRDVYSVLSSAIAPRPIAFVSSIDKEGQVNLSPFSFFNVFGANPPTVVFSPVRSMRTLENKDTLQNIEEIQEVTISVVTYAMIEQMSLASTAYPKGVNEYVKAGFTPEPSDLVSPPFVGESPVSLECKVIQVIETGREGGAGNLVICEVVMIHVDEKQVDEDGLIDSANLDLVARLGGNYYCRADRASLFEVAKPIRTQGIGVDALPIEVRESPVLSGNNLGRLGNLEKTPSKEELALVKDGQGLSMLELHQLAKEEVEKGNTYYALKLLLASKE